MRLLVTNDDGIDAVFLHELIHALRAAGHELFVVAPKFEQSWTGSSKSRHRAVTSAIVDRGFGCPTWTVDGTPSDCVNIGLAYLLPRSSDPLASPPVTASATTAAVDGVVSGINIGINCTLGFILASGTIAGAWEGALHGLPAIAFSQDVSFAQFDALKSAGGIPEPGLAATLRINAARAAQLTGELLATTPRASFTVHNINLPVPARADAPLKRTVPAHVVVPRLFSPAADDGTHRFIYAEALDRTPPGLTTDRAAVAAGFISHTLLDYTQLGRP